MEIFLFLTLISNAFCFWESEWMVPIQDSFRNEASKKTADVDFKILDGDAATERKPIYDDRREELLKDEVYGIINNEDRSISLIEKLKDTLQNARILAERLKTQIIDVTSQENFLKEAIVSGRSGVTVLSVQSLGKPPRNYIIRDGFWTLCSGIVQFPGGHGSTNIFNELFASPRCIGQEIATIADPCVFNSVIKYETIPTRHDVVYTEEEYLCLKPSFNQTLEQYLSVPKYIVNETCKNGLIRKLADNSLDCGMRVLSEYTYYPQKGLISRLPLEYCTEKDGACKLTVAWHISNSSIENFEYIKSDMAFKNFFMNAETRKQTL